MYRNTIIVFTPSSQQQNLINPVIRGIRDNSKEKFDIALFTDKLNDNFEKNDDLIIRLPNENDLNRCNNVYFKEGRTDIPAFAAYAQFLIPKYFQEFDYILYLEVDMMVRGDLKPLIDHCIDSKAILGAARFLDIDFKPISIPSLKRVNPKAKCYNTGVLFLDVNECLNTQFEERCFEIALEQKQNKGTLYDYYAQGALNTVFYDEIYEFDWKFNTPHLGYFKGISRKIIEDAVILHWTGTLKPWKNEGLYKEYYYNSNDYYNESDYNKEHSYIYLKLHKLKRLIKRFI